MVRASKNGKSGCWPHVHAAGLLCALGLMLSLQSGCSSLKGTQTASSDPLMGERVPEQPFGVAGPTPPPQNRAGMTGPPQSTASKSNAAMLVPDPLVGAKPIAIADSKTPQQSSTTGTWQTKDSQPTTAVTGGVQLRTPEPVPIQPVAPPTNVPNGSFGPGAAIQPVPPPPVVAAPAAVPIPVPHTVTPVGFTEADPLQTALKSRGVIWQDQKAVADGVQFTCRVTNPLDPNFLRVYEATARDYQSAVQAVLLQIDQQPKTN
jgi:hypothetical protein